MFIIFLFVDGMTRLSLQCTSLSLLTIFVLKTILSDISQYNQFSFLVVPICMIYIFPFYFQSVYIFQYKIFPL